MNLDTGTLVKSPETEGVWNHPEEAVERADFRLVFDKDRGGISSLRRCEDVYDTEYIKLGHLLGDISLTYRQQGAAWMDVDLDDPDLPFQVISATPEKMQVNYLLPDDLKLIKTYTFEGPGLVWDMELRNLGGRNIEIGDIALPLRMNTDYVGGDLQDEDAVQKTYHNRLNRHRLIAGHGSFVSWMRANGAGPYLLMTPTGNTHLEYFDEDYTAYIHAAHTGRRETRGTWRQEHTGITLEPAGEKGDAVRYGFSFSWADDYDGVRDVLYESGGYDVQIVPGMTLPRDLSARFALRTRNRIESVQPEYAESTKLVYLGEKEPDVHLYEVSFAKLGENLIRVNDAEGHHMLLEFFCTEPLETLYRKRARFIAEKQQHRNSEWYNGLFSIWDMQEGVLRGPDDKGGLDEYMVGGSDDPSNSKAVLVAEKNVALPDAGEIAALEYHLEHFVWGKLQRTDEESPHPYGIYGSENWYLNRTTKWGTTNEERIQHLERTYGDPQGTGLGAERMWRSFDYTTFIMLYYNMYCIAKEYPHLVSYLNADEYLERAYGTAKAYFEVPYAIFMPGKPLWSHEGYSDWAYKLGNFHELYIVDVMDALREEGAAEKADWLQGEWEKKVKYFLYDEPFPFGSEFVFDRTAFESTHALARYAVEHPLGADTNLWYDKNLQKWYSHPDVKPEDAVAFMKRQIDANISMRGWLENTYYYLGAARVGSSTLDYMSQMAGWSILDYGLRYSDDPAEYIRLGYASLLSSWALVNSGTPESDYGYWYPGEQNDGAAGWNFQTHKHGTTWNFGQSVRGPWPHDGEIDHGFAGGVRAAATVVLDDPLFGKIAFGGSLESKAGLHSVVPKDGVRRRLHFISNAHRVHLRLNADGFKKEEPVRFDDAFRQITFILENRSGRVHDGSFEIEGLPEGEYVVLLEGERIHSFTSSAGSTERCPYRITELAEHAVLINRL